MSRDEVANREASTRQEMTIVLHESLRALCARIRGGSAFSACAGNALGMFPLGINA